MTEDPHEGHPIETTGADPAEASAAVVMAHGRGAMARGMLDIAREFDREDVAYLAPQAARREWYPNSFLSPIDANEPWLTSALSAFGRALDRAVDAGIGHERVLLLGFSQGACLATEFAVRTPRRYGGVVAFSGGVIGPDGTEWNDQGSLAGTPAFLGCSDSDPHIPEERVHETAAVLRDLDADVEERIYEGMAHTVNGDELAYAAAMVADL
jgi:predicted esterase